MPAKRIVCAAFVVSALGCAVAGILLGGYSNSANPSIAQSYVFSALAALIVGGNRVNGGRGGALQTVTGTMIIAVITDLLAVAGFSYAWEEFVTGVVIVGAVATDNWLQRFQ